MILNEIGLIVQDEWLKTPGLRPDMNIMLDKFGVMPDHFHGIIFIGDNEYNHNGKDPIKVFSILPGLPIIFGDQADNVVGTGQRENDFGPQAKNLASIIRGFKSAVTTRARRINKVFKWQERYHDHVVRDYDSLERIRDYIDNNPANWIE